MYRCQDYLVVEYKDNTVDIVFIDNADKVAKVRQQDSNVKKVFVGTTAECTKDFSDLALFTGKKLYRLLWRNTSIINMTPINLYKNLSDNK